MSHTSQRFLCKYVMLLVNFIKFNVYRPKRFFHLLDKADVTNGHFYPFLQYEQ